MPRNANGGIDCPHVHKLMMQAKREGHMPQIGIGMSDTGGWHLWQSDLERIYGVKLVCCVYGECLARLCVECKTKHLSACIEHKEQVRKGDFGT